MRRNIFNWKHEEAGNLEAKIKSFCEAKQVLRFLKDFILFAEKEEELQKFVLRQHQMGGADQGKSCDDKGRMAGGVRHKTLAFLDSPVSGTGHAVSSPE